MKPFALQDLGSFLPNEWSNPDPVLDQLTDPAFVTITMWEKDMVAAILCFKCYWGQNWHGFFLIAQDFPAKLGRKIRAFIISTMERLGAERLQTDSVACPTLDKWHKFLGFKLEGTREKLMNGRDYNMWARMRGGK